MKQTLRVGILGATGAVGQKFIKQLSHHPWFKVTALGASERSAGKPYKQAAHWIENTPIPNSIAELVVQPCDPAHFSGVDFVFSGLDSSVAGDVERAFASRGIPVISNAKNYRTDPTVPLLIPEVNPGHIEMIHHQTFTEDGSGWIVTNPNCVAVPLTMTLKPLHDAFGIESVVVTSLQAISGAGYPGVASLDIVGNVVPFIPGEESKVEQEPLKMLATLEGGRLQEPGFPVQATATRVPVINGHLLSVSVSLKQPLPQASTRDAMLEEAMNVLKEWESPVTGLNLPSAPKKPLLVHENPFHPQPRLHADSEGGMRTALGRLRAGSVHHLSYIAMAHNTLRGAAGGAILNAELLVARGKLSAKK